MKKLIFLYFIIFLEGYVVLSAELLAIRQVIPYVGNATDVVSIIIAAVLMPLALGYYAGGHFARRDRNGGRITVRRKLLQNILIANLFLFFGLSHVFIDYFFQFLGHIGIQNRLVMVSSYSVIFMVIPVFLLAQTIPLISNFFKKEELSQITGKILFFSTVGSFMGAVFSTLVLMALLGVHHTAVITLGCLTLLYICLNKITFRPSALLMIALFIAALLLNNDYVMKRYNIIENNQYNAIRVVSERNGLMRVLSLNNNHSSVLIDRSFLADPQDNFASRYVNYINKHYITPTLEDDKVYSILVVGAGGFTIGLDDDKNQYIYIDIDGALKEISEKHFLKQKIGENKEFKAVPARGYLHQISQTDTKFDLIILDAYAGGVTLPEHLATKDFYAKAKSVLQKDGILIANFVASPNFTDQFSINLDNTLRKVFPSISRHVLNTYNGWDKSLTNHDNVLYIHYNKDMGDAIYTDNKSTIYYDKDRPLKKSKN